MTVRRQKIVYYQIGVQSCFCKTYIEVQKWIVEYGEMTPTLKQSPGLLSTFVYFLCNTWLMAALMPLDRMAVFFHFRAHGATSVFRDLFGSSPIFSPRAWNMWRLPQSFPSLQKIWTFLVIDNRQFCGANEGRREKIVDNFHIFNV